MRYIPHTEQDIAQMLGCIGLGSVEELFQVIPEALRLRGSLPLPPALCEAELLDHLEALGSRNRPASQATGTRVFAGAGLYAHAIPSAVGQLAGRSEFYTAYTPYQPEVAQGTLLGIFEFQTLACELLGMEVANASMYDGASAAAEAVLMARRMTGRERTLLCRSLHPEYARTCRTYLAGLGSPEALLGEVPWEANGGVDLAALRAALDETVAAVVVQSPNMLGLLEDWGPLAEAAHAAGALLVAVCPEPLMLGIARPPGEAGADIAVAEGAGLAGPLNLGGPGVGLFAASGKKALRALPGRLVGQTVDADGRPGFVLTLSTREQHIRREKATSNICTNHGLMALRFTIHLALLGRSGFTRLARLNLSRTAFAREQLAAVPGYSLVFDGPRFNELLVRVPGGEAQALIERAASRGLVPGVALSRFYPDMNDLMLVAVNESHGRDDILRLCQELSELGAAHASASHGKER